MKPDTTPITRSYDFSVVRAESRDDGLTLEGYAAVFNSDTTINSWEGHFTERIAPGAFTKTLSERTPVLQFDHGTHPLIGSIPLGNIQTLREDSQGLFVRARLSDNWLVEPVRDAIRDGAIDGMSFRFTVPEGKDTWDYDTEVPTRTVHEVKLHELGPVVFPAYPQTSVGVRSNELLSLLADDQIRSELAQILAFGQPEAAPSTSTPDEPPVALVNRKAAIAKARIALDALLKTA